MTIASGAELPHAPGPEASWAESWTFDFARADGLGGFVRLAVLPAAAVAWYWAYVVGPDIGLVAVRDHEVPLPRRADDLELRADSLWAEVVCETPLEHWGLGLEAFGLRYEDHEEERAEIGERLAVGLDLEWELLGPAVGAVDAAAGRYSQAGTVHGDLLVGPDRFPFEGAGVREHAWGGGDAWASCAHRSGLCFGEMLAFEVVTNGADEDQSGWLWRLGEEPEPVTHALVETHRGPDGIPVAARWVLNHELEVEAEVRVVASVPLDAPPGRASRRCRALCLAQTSDGTVGTGWADWPAD